MSITSDQQFKLHAQLVADTLPVISLPLCDVLLVNDKRYLWCILVPRITGLRDLHDVPADSRLALLEEINELSAIVKDLTKAHKMNVAALGNMVEQLHIHVVSRHRNDAAWPGPVWGVGEAVPYPKDSSKKLISEIKARLGQFASDKTNNG